MDLIEIFSDPKSWVSLLTLSLLEIVLGIDNIVFLAILSGKLPPDQRSRARRIGLMLALAMRVVLLLGISWIMGMKSVLFTLFGKGFTGRDLILIGGGLFLVAKATFEIHEKLEVSHEDGGKRAASKAFGWVLTQIVLMDIVFSLDSVITAVGMVKHIPIMIAAVVIAMGVMLVFANSISDFVIRHPSIKVLALSFLLLIGVLLIADGMGKHIEKGYIYFAMAFSLVVELINMRVRRSQRDPVELHSKFEGERR